MDKFIRSNPLPSARKIKQFDWIIGKSFCPCHLCLFLFFSTFILRIFSMKTLIHWPFDVSIFSWHVFTNISNQKCIKSLERKEKHFHFTLFDSTAIERMEWSLCLRLSKPRVFICKARSKIESNKSKDYLKKSPFEWISK